MIIAGKNAGIFVPLFFMVLSLFMGCDKSTTTTTTNGAQETILEFGGTDVKADGTLSDSTLQAIAAKSSDKALAISFLRTRLSDTGLEQMAKFPNIRHITATGSALTPDGIAKLKKAIPEVEVSH